MSDRSKDYIHGYSTTEQERLIQQAQYWRNDLILRDFNYKSGDKLLEIGCGAGAVLGILATAFSGLKIAGIDLETKQINYARQHLSQLGITNADLIEFLPQIKVYLSDLLTISICSMFETGF